MINLYDLMRWLNPLIFALGCGVAIWAFQKNRKKGYLIIAAYFALAIFSFVVMPPINRAMATHRKPDISIETEKKLDAAIQETTQRVLAEAGVDRPPVVGRMNIIFPLGPVLLVIGLWLVAKKDKETPNQASEVTARKLAQPQV